MENKFFSSINKRGIVVILVLLFTTTLKAAVFGPDERVALRSLIGFERLVGMYGDYCSGVVIDEHHILTAAHCIVKKSGEIRIHPFYQGRSGRRRSASIIANPVKIYYPSYYFDTNHIPNRGFDVALVKFEERLFYTEDFPGFIVGDSLFGNTLLALGYPGDRARLIREWPHQSECSSEGLDGDTFILHKCDTAGGQSGGPLFSKNATGDVRLAGIITAAKYDRNLRVNHNIDLPIMNYAIMLSDRVQQKISLWIQDIVDSETVVWER